MEYKVAPRTGIGMLCDTVYCCLCMASPAKGSRPLQITLRNKLGTDGQASSTSRACAANCNSATTQSNTNSAAEMPARSQYKLRQGTCGAGMRAHCKFVSRLREGRQRIVATLPSAPSADRLRPANVSVLAEQCLRNQSIQQSRRQLSLAQQMHPPPT